MAVSAVRSDPHPPRPERAFPIKVRYEATPMERQLVPAMPAAVAAAPRLDPKEREAYLAPAKWYDYEALVFADWLAQAGLRRAAGEARLAFPQRAYLKLGEKFTYKAATAGRPHR